MIIYLIGMPGSGKSYISKELSHTLGCSLVDMDAYIEKEQGKSITSIFEDKGEDYFRKQERKFLLNYAVDNTVISTGGGTPCYFENINTMKEKGKVIYINTPISIITQRIYAEEHRPMFDGYSKESIMYKLKELYDKRKIYYKRAHITFHTAFEHINDLLEKL